MSIPSEDGSTPGAARLERVAIEVDDIDQFRSALHRALGIELRVVDADELGLLAAVGNQGIELVQRKVPHPRAAQYFKPPLPASTMVEVAKMTSPDYLIEISAIAVIPAP